MKEPLLPIRANFVQLRSFEAVARLGGVGRAAQALHLAQPTVSTQLRELAAALEMQLFEPIGRGLQLTAEGELLLGLTRELFERWRGFEEELADLRGLKSGRLRLAAVTTTEYFLPDWLGPFARQHPGIEIELAVENRDAVIRRLHEGSAELAVMMLPPPDLPLERLPLMENPLVLIGAHEHPLAQRRRNRWEALLREPRLTREAGSGTRLVTDQFLASRGLDWAPRMALGSNEALKHAVAAGLGLAVLSRHSLGESLPGLAIVPAPGLPIRRQWQAVWRSDRRLSLPARALLQAWQGRSD